MLDAMVLNLVNEAVDGFCRWADRLPDVKFRRKESPRPPKRKHNRNVMKNHSSRPNGRHTVNLHYHQHIHQHVHYHQASWRSS